MVVVGSYVWMGGDEGIVEERGREDSQNILKFSTFHEPSHLLSSHLPPFPSIPNIPFQCQENLWTQNKYGCRRKDCNGSCSSWHFYHHYYFINMGHVCVSAWRKQKRICMLSAPPRTLVSSALLMKKHLRNSRVSTYAKQLSFKHYMGFINLLLSNIFSTSSSQDCLVFSGYCQTHTQTSKIKTMEVIPILYF